MYTGFSRFDGRLFLVVVAKLAVADERREQLGGGVACWAGAVRPGQGEVRWRRAWQGRVARS
jgi:hypothetical protein